MNERWEITPFPYMSISAWECAGTDSTPNLCLLDEKLSLTASVNKEGGGMKDNEKWRNMNLHLLNLLRRTLD